MFRVKNGLSQGRKSFIKTELIRKYGPVCYICNRKLTYITIDHFDNEDKDGYNDINNLRLCCDKCNNTKSIFENILNGRELSDRLISKLCGAYSYFNNVVKEKYVHSDRSS